LNNRDWLEVIRRPLCKSARQIIHDSIVNEFLAMKAIELVQPSSAYDLSIQSCLKGILTKFQILSLVLESANSTFDGENEVAWSVTLEGVTTTFF